MQYTITEKLKRLMYKILVAFLGVMFGSGARGALGFGRYRI